VLILVATLLVKSKLYCAVPEDANPITISLEVAASMLALTVKVSPSEILVAEEVNVITGGVDSP
jgi:hypothetical protein